jgi:hypothetical protein
MLQDVAVAGGMVEWLVDNLYAHADTMEQHSAEFMTALLVNLAQRSAGRYIHAYIHTCIHT